jgi:hypothetical protein
MMLVSTKGVSDQTPPASMSSSSVARIVR